MIREKKDFYDGLEQGLTVVLKFVLIVFFTLMIMQMADAQSRIRDKATETTLTGTELLGIDRADYGLIKKVSTSAIKSYVLDGLTIHNSTIGGLNTAGWSEGKILKFNATGDLIVADDATGGTGGGAVVISDLTDVNTAGMISNQILKYNGTTHVPWTINLENVRALGNTLSGSIYLDETHIDGALTLNDDFRIALGYAAGKVLTSDALGYATWQDPAASVVQAGNGIRLDAGGSPGQVEINFYPYALPVISSPIPANISFGVDYAGDERKLTFQQASALMLQEQTYMTLFPETSVVLDDYLSTTTICSLEVSLQDGEGATIPLAYADNTDFALTGNYCNPYFDDIDENKYYFCVGTFDLNKPANEVYSVTVTHTPSGANKTWYLQVWGGGGSTGGGGVGLDGDDVIAMMPDESIVGKHIADNAISSTHINNGTIAEEDLNSNVQEMIIHVVSSWPTSGSDEGFYWVRGSGIRYYYSDIAHGCTWQFEDASGNQVCAQ